MWTSLHGTYGSVIVQLQCPPIRWPAADRCKCILPWQWRIPDLSLCALEWPEVLWLEVEGWQGAASSSAQCYGSTPASLRRTCASPAAARRQQYFFNKLKQSATFLTTTITSFSQSVCYYQRNFSKFTPHVVYVALLSFSPRKKATSDLLPFKDIFLHSTMSNIFSFGHFQLPCW